MNLRLGLNINSVHQGTLLNPMPTANDIISTFGSHIIALWPLSDASGNTAVDISGNGINAAYSGTVTKAQEGFNDEKSANFTSGFLNPYSANLNARFNPNEGYVSAWVKFTGNWDTTAGTLFNLYADASNRMLLRTLGDGTIQAFCALGGVSTSMSIDSLSGSRFVNIGLRWSKSGGYISIFINGLESKRKAGMTGTWVGNLNQAVCAFFQSLNPLYAQDVYMLDYAPTASDIAKSLRINGILVLEGDSRTDTKFWNSLAAEVNTTKTKIFANRFGLSVQAVSGSKVGDMVARAATTNSLIVSGKRNVLVVLIGVNNDGTLTTQQLYDAIKSYCINARAAGWNKIILCKEINSTKVGWSVQYLALNALIDADHSWVDDVVDLGARVELQNPANTTYFTDGIHLTQAGYAIVGEEVSAKTAKYIT